MEERSVSEVLLRPGSTTSLFALTNSSYDRAFIGPGIL
jgi:hypothetical protein